MRHILTVALLVVLVLFAAGCLGGGTSGVPFDRPNESSVPSYEVVAQDDQSFSDDNGKVVQLTRSVRTTPDAAELTEQQMFAVGKAVIANAASERELTEIKVFLYADGVPTGGGACGVVTWAPGGEFGNANKVDPGEYSSHEFVVEQNPVLCQPV